MKTTQFKKGQVVTLKDHEIEVLKVYPRGHKNAGQDSNFYLVRSTDYGEDVLSEAELIRQTGAPRKYKVKLLTKISGIIDLVICETQDINKLSSDIHAKHGTFITISSTLV